MPRTDVKPTYCKDCFTDLSEHESAEKLCQPCEAKPDQWQKHRLHVNELVGIVNDLNKQNGWSYRKVGV